jgi:hypothetical protein
VACDGNTVRRTLYLTITGVTGGCAAGLVGQTFQLDYDDSSPSLPWRNTSAYTAGTCSIPVNTIQLFCSAPPLLYAVALLFAAGSLQQLTTQSFNPFYGTGTITGAAFSTCCSGGGTITYEITETSP